jgi:hypothetical protein
MNGTPQRADTQVRPYGHRNKMVMFAHANEWVTFHIGFCLHFRQIFRDPFLCLDGNILILS